MNSLEIQALLNIPVVNIITFFVKSHNGDIIKSNLKIIKYENFRQLLSKGPNYGEHK